MLIFAHVFAGAAFGLVLGWFLCDTRLIPLCIAASVIPDFIDKPLGYILLPQALDSGRTYFHALIAVAMITALAFVVWRFRRGNLLFFAAGAVLLHQILDGMWREPVTWFYPVLGPFQPYHYINYFGTYFWVEVTSVSEWVFLFATLLLLSLIYVSRLTPPFPPPASRLMVAVNYITLLLLAVLGFSCLWSGITGAGNALAPDNTPEKNVIMGVVALTGFCILAAFRRIRLLSEHAKN
jgi:hypothetical protein